MEGKTPNSEPFVGSEQLLKLVTTEWLFSPFIYSLLSFDPSRTIHPSL